MPFDECGFCDRVLDEDEELTPIYAGEPDADAEARVGDVIELREQVLVDTDREFDHSRELGRAVREADLFGAEVLPVEEVVYGMDGRVRPIGSVESVEVHGQRVETDRIHDRVSVRFTFKVPTKRVLERTDYDVAMPEPDLEVCKYCVEAFGGSA